MPSKIDLDPLVRRTVTGDPEAWSELQVALQPEILAIARGHRGLRSKGLAALPDDLAEIMTATLERLRTADFQNLKRFTALESQGEARPKSFDAWLYGAVDFVIREHIRQRFGRAPKLSSAEAPRFQPSKRDLQSQAGRLDDELERGYLRTLGMTARLTVLEIFAHMEQDFEPQDAEAMRLYYVENRDFEEIAGSLGLGDAKGAERLIRKLNARLRYHFVDSDRDDS